MFERDVFKHRFEVANYAAVSLANHVGEREQRDPEEVYWAVVNHFDAEVSRRLLERLVTSEMNHAR